MTAAWTDTPVAPIGQGRRLPASDKQRTFAGIKVGPAGIFVVFDDGTLDGPYETKLDAFAAALTAEPETRSSTWRPVDLASYLDGSHQPPEATLLKRADGAGLAYPGRVHWISGEPEAMKSWLGVYACAQALHRGRRVVYIDLEDGAAGIAGRLLALGVDPRAVAQHLTYLSPDGPLRYADRDDLSGLVATAELLVIDACTEALALQGLSSKEDTDIATWLNLLPRWAAKLGPAVFVLDHVVKDSEARGRWATGSGHKLAGLDGAAYSLEAVQPGGIGMTGRSRLYVVKDRHGQVRPHSVSSTGGRYWLADLVVDSTGPFTEAVLHAPTTHPETFIPTAVMAKVAAALTKAGKALTKSEIEDRVGGRATVVRQAIAALDDLGHLDIKPGPHNSRLHTLIRPYPPEEETT